MSKSSSSGRLPKGYDGCAVTNHRIGDLLSKALERIGQRYQLHPDLVLAAWPALVSPRIALMSRAVSFENGILAVKVTNSTCLSLLCTDKGRILSCLRKKFPTLAISDVRFRIG